jgi:hypothetical protein
MFIKGGFGRAELHPRRSVRYWELSRRDKKYTLLKRERKSLPTQGLETALLFNYTATQTEVFQANNEKP